MYLISLILSFLSPVSIGHSQSISTPCKTKSKSLHCMQQLTCMISSWYRLFREEVKLASWSLRDTIERNTWRKVGGGQKKESQDLSGDGVATEGDEDREVGVLQLEAVHVRHQACNHVQGLLGDSGWIED